MYPDTTAGGLESSDQKEGFMEWIMEHDTGLESSPITKCSSSHIGGLTVHPHHLSTITIVVGIAAYSNAQDTTNAPHGLVLRKEPCHTRTLERAFGHVSNMSATMDYISGLPIEVLQMILGYVPQDEMGAFLQTSRQNYVSSGYNLYRHIGISSQSPQQIFQLCVLSFNTNYVSKHARTLTIDALLLGLPSEGVVSFADSEMIIQWITKLFPDPPMDKKTPETVAQAEKGRRLWRRGFFQSDINALLAAIVVNGKNLRQVSLDLAHLGKEPTFSQLMASKLAYDSATGVETFPRMQSFSITPSYVDNVVPFLPHLRHFALQYTSDDVRLCIHLHKRPALGNLQTLKFYHVYDAANKVQQVLSLGHFPSLTRLSISEPIWNDDLSYPDLVSLIQDHCPSLQVFVLDFADTLDANPSNKPKPLLSALQSVATARIHVGHLPDSYQDVAVVTAPEQPAWPANATRLEITGLTVPMLHSIAAAYVMSLPVDINLRNVQQLRLVFDSDSAQNAPLDQEIQDFDDILNDVIDAAKKQGVHLGVYLRRAGDLDAVDEFYMGIETEPIL